MSNYTQIAALMALVEEYANAWRDWGAREDGQNGMIAARAAVEASARQLAEQAAPTDYRLMLEARDALCEYANKGEVSSDVEGLIASMSFSLDIAGEQPQQAAPGFVMVPVDELKAAINSVGSFVSDHGWTDQDMQNMDNLEALLAQHTARLASRPLTAAPIPEASGDDEREADLCKARDQATSLLRRNGASPEIDDKLRALIATLDREIDAARAQKGKA